MHSPMLRATAIVALSAGITLPCAAQAPRAVLVGLGGGQTFPTGDFGTDNKPGFNVGGYVQYRAPDAMVGLRGELSYHRNDMKDAFLQDLGADPSTTGHWSTLYVGLAGVLERMPRGAAFGWFLAAGGGMYRIEPTISQSGINQSSSESKPGFNAGGGVRFRMGAASLFVEGRYHGVKLDDVNYTFLPVSLGIAF